MKSVTLKRTKYNTYKIEMIEEIPLVDLAIFLKDEAMSMSDFFVEWLKENNPEDCIRG